MVLAMNRKVLIRRPNPEKSGAYLYWVSKGRWSPEKDKAFTHPNDFAAARILISEDIKNGQIINKR